PAREQVRARRLAERALEGAAEVRARETGRGRHLLDADRLGVARVREVLRSQQMAVGRDEGHAGTQYRARDAYRWAQAVHRFAIFPLRAPAAPASTMGVLPPSPRGSRT